MGLFNLFKKKKEVKKDIIQKNIVSLINSMSSNSYDQFKNISFQQAINYFLTVAPLAHAIETRAETFGQIPIILQNVKTFEYEYNHPLLDLLNYPNANFSGIDFKEHLALFYDMTGNVMIEATGRVENPPLELYTQSIQSFTINPSQQDGFAQSYMYNSASGSLTYNRQEKSGRFRFYANELKELWHIKKFNPNFSMNDLYGSIPIAKIASEVEQYARASNHNLNMLKNGARLSAILLAENALSDKQYARLKEQMNNEYSGDTNTGRILLAEGGKLNVKELSQTNKDMDFKENKKDNKYMIYLFYKIPLPLVSPDHMTLSNYQEARLSLYDEAVLPLADKILTELTNFLIPRYKDLENKFKLTYNPLDVIALEYRANQNIKNKKETGAFSINELRDIAGYDKIENGDAIYQQVNLVPLGTQTEGKMIEKSKFIKILKRNNTPEGTIKQYVEKYFPN